MNRIVLLIMAALLWAGPALAVCPVPHDFVVDQVAVANDVNLNFTAHTNCIAPLQTATASMTGLEAAVGGVNILLNTELNNSSKLAGILTDASGAGGTFMRQNAPQFVNGFSIDFVDTVVARKSAGVIGVGTAGVYNAVLMVTNIGGSIQAWSAALDTLAAGDFSAAADLDASGAVSANAVLLATDTLGNYVATIADSGASEVTVANSGTENAGVTLAIVSGLTRDTELNAKTLEGTTVSTNNAVVRFTGADGDLQNSGVLIDASNNITIPGSITGGTSGGACFIIKNRENTQDYECDVSSGAWGCVSDSDGICNGS